jgi:glycosyltransferase involved in cell wall biosynthesis
MPASIGVSAVFRSDQVVGGAFSVFSNLMGGFIELLEESQSNPPFEMTIFHGRAKPPWHSERLRWQLVPDRFGRFVADTHIGARFSRDLDAVLFLNYFTPPVVRAARAVTIIHDLQYLHMKHLYRPGKRLWLRLCHEWSLRKCARVVVISQAVKDDLLHQYGDRFADLVHVIWNPVDVDRFSGAGQSDVAGGRPYVLCVSVDRPQKNLYRLIQAFQVVRQAFPDYVLVLAGQLRSLRRAPREQSAKIGSTMPATIDLVRELGIEDHVRVTGFITDSQLGALYRGATMCVLPSLFEGFGMPAVESLAMGKPTLVTGLPVLREVTLNSAQYLDDPEKVGAIAADIKTILKNPSQFQPPPEIVAKVRSSFAPRNVAEQYLRVLLA